MLNFTSVNITAIVIFIVLLIAYFNFDISIYWFLVLGFAWLLLTVLGSGLIGWNYHINSLNANPETRNNEVAITFDDGPNPKFTPLVLKLLEKYNAQATFFCIGKHIEEQPEVFKSIIKNGHTIGNHTYSHSNKFGLFSTQEVITELQKTQNIIEKYTGLVPMLYRPAFGVTNPKIKRAVKTIGLRTVGWNKRSLDTTPLKEQVVLSRITKHLKKGDIILLHDTSEKTIVVLEQLLLILQQKNLTSVTVDQLFNVKAYA